MQGLMLLSESEVRDGENTEKEEGVQGQSPF